MAKKSQAETPEVEERLRAARPTPETTFVDGLERRLGLQPASARRRVFGRAAEPRVRRPALAAGLAVLAIAGATLALGLAGAGPLGDDGPADARDECRFVTVQKRIRVPVVVTGHDGLPEVRLGSRLVDLREKRCP